MRNLSHGIFPAKLIVCMAGIRSVNSQSYRVSGDIRGTGFNDLNAVDINADDMKSHFHPAFTIDIAKVGSAAKEASMQSWHEMVRAVLKDNKVRLVTYVPDRVLTPLIEALHADPFFKTFPTAREEEAVGIVTGAWMAGLHGVILMQTSGFATIPNVLASLAIPYQIPLLAFVSERGTLGEFNSGQALVCRTMRPVLDSLAVEHHTITRLDELAFIVDRSIKQAVATRAPVVFILSPLLTGGKVFEG